jgi:hypothetical protein
MTKARDIASAAPAPSTVDATELGYLDGVTSAIQTQLDAKTAKSTLTTTGDIYYASAANTPARLAIGSTSDVLTVVAGVPGWAAPAGGSGFTLIQRSTFSNVADTSTTFDGVFTSTYDTYFVNIDEIYAVTQANDLHLQFRYAGPTTQTSTYYAANFGYTYNNTLTTSGVDNGSQVILSTDSGASDRPCVAQLYVNHVGNASEYATVDGLVYNNTGLAMTVVYGTAFTARTYTGFLLKSSSSNISGTVAIYGLAKS